jgi:adenylate cyclase
VVQSAKKKLSLGFIRWVLVLGVPSLWCALNHWELLAYFENRTLDWRFKARKEIPAPINVVYVDVDSRSLDEIGNFPWSRRYFAKVTQALLEQAKVRAIGFDFVLSPTGQPEVADPAKMRAGDAELGRLVCKFPPAIPPPAVFAASFAAEQFRAAEGKMAQRRFPFLAKEKRALADIEPPEKTTFATPAGGVISPPYIGLIDTDYGGTRTVACWAPTSTGTFYHEALELARLYWKLPQGSLKTFDDRLEFVRPDGSVQATIPLRQRQLVDVNWFSSWESKYNPRQSFSVVYTYADMLTSEKTEEREAAGEFFSSPDWKDAVVLVGPVDPLLQDVATTPMDDGPVPRVGVHGNLLKTIISGKYLRYLPEVAEIALVFVLSVGISLLAASSGKRRGAARTAAFLLLAGYVGFAFWIFKSQHLVLPLTAPVGGIFMTTFAAVGWQLLHEEKQKGRIKGMFGAYVSPQLVNRMVESGEDPQLGGHDDEITAYFSDIQSFSTFSEKLGSGPLVELMNEYLTACTDIVQAQGGTLDKYIGDAVVAMFGAPLPLPDHAYRACVATQLVHQKLSELRAKWESEGTKWPKIVWEMQSRIGLNTGVCMIGNMGSRTRFNYTMMGDNVNLAARMESGSKAWGAYTMCSESTKLACEKHGDRVVFRALGRIVVKGRTIPVPIFEITGLKDTLPPRAMECIALFEQGLAKYYERDWDGAIALFKQSAELEPNQPGKTPGVKTNPSLVYIGISEKYKEEPPEENWDGVYHMTEK